MRHAHHILNGQTFGDAHDQLNAAVGSFEDGIRGKPGRDEDNAGIGAGGFDGIPHRVKDGDFTIQHPFAALAGGHAGDDVGAVGYHLVVWNNPSLPVMP